jgi:hypothetical protein
MGVLMTCQNNLKEFDRRGGRLRGDSQTRVRQQRVSEIAPCTTTTWRSSMPEESKMKRDLTTRGHWGAFPRLSLGIAMLLLNLAAMSLAADPDDLARQLLGKTGLRVGVCELPRVGDGTLAAALASQGVGQVHGLAADARAAEAARKPSASCGVLGSQVVIEAGNPSAIPLGDWVADLLVVADATDADLQDLPAAEVQRVLSPYRGVAVIGQAKGGRGGLTKVALAAWAKHVSVDAQVAEDASGLWAVARMAPLAGGDDWSHYQHGPDGNPVSKDTVLFAAPFGLQWWGKPWAENGHAGPDVHVVSAGRIFSATSNSANDVLAGGRLIARNVYNGEILWSRPYSKENFGRYASLLVATPRRVFFKEDNRVLVLDPETGAEMRRVTATDEKRDCIWLAVSDGVLLTLAGPRHTYTREEWSGRQVEDGRREKSLYLGEELAAWDVGSGRQLWRFRAPRIGPYKLVVSDGRIFLYARPDEPDVDYAACLDLKSGKQAWKTDNPMPEDRTAYAFFNDLHQALAT